jgi:superfamily I DNA/RNA helicase
VRLTRIHSAEGPQSPAAILAGLDLLPVPIEPDEVRDSKLLYVGLTRAVDELYVSWASRSAFTDRVLRSSKVTPLD